MLKINVTLHLFHKDASSKQKFASLTWCDLVSIPRYLLRRLGLTSYCASIPDRLPG
jgi:hypothetical protein